MHEGKMGHNPEISKAEKLNLLKEKIDKFAAEIVKTWNEDKGWSLTLLGEELENSYLDEYNTKAEQLAAIQNKNHEKKQDLAEVEKKFLKLGKGKIKKEINEGEEAAAQVDKEMGELSAKQKESREKFETLKRALETVLTEYFFTIRGTDEEKEWENKFPYARIYVPSYHDLRTGQTSPEDKKRELEDTKAYIYDFRKMFEQYGADIYKRELKP